MLENDHTRDKTRKIFDVFNIREDSSSRVISILKSRSFDGLDCDVAIVD